MQILCIYKNSTLLVFVYVILMGNLDFYTMAINIYTLLCFLSLFHLAILFSLLRTPSLFKKNPQGGFLALPRSLRGLRVGAATQGKVGTEHRDLVAGVDGEV